MSPAVMVLIYRDKEILLARSWHFKAGMFSAVAGFIELGESAETAAFPVTVTDAVGNEITIDEAPERIVTLSPVNTEILYGLGLGDEIVGRTDNDNYPPEVTEKPSVGDIMFSAEEVIALNPDIVFAHGSGMYKECERARTLVQWRDHPWAPVDIEAGGVMAPPFFPSSRHCAAALCPSTRPDLLGLPQ